jgi:hypothetical protein
MLSAILPPTMEGAIEPADVSEAEQIIRLQTYATSRRSALLCRE